MVASRITLALWTYNIRLTRLVLGRGGRTNIFGDSGSSSLTSKVSAISDMLTRRTRYGQHACFVVVSVYMRGLREAS